MMTLIDDCRLALSVMAKCDEFPTGRGVLEQAAMALEAKNASIAELVEVLEAFAEHAKERCADTPEWCDNDTASIIVSIGQLRAATAALAKHKPDNTARLMYLAQREADGTPRDIAERDWEASEPAQKEAN